MQDYLFDEDDNTEALQGIGLGIGGRDTMETSDIAEGDNLVFFD